MENISEILEEQCIRLELKSRKKNEVIEELVQILVSCGKVDNSSYFTKELLVREKLSSTGIGQGIAIPHKLLPEIKNTIMAFGRKEKGIPFDSIDGKPAHLFFLVLGPEGKHADHLKLLSRLSRLLNDQEFRQQLMNAETNSEILRFIREKETS